MWKIRRPRGPRRPIADELDALPNVASGVKIRDDESPRWNTRTDAARPLIDAALDEYSERRRGLEAMHPRRAVTGESVEYRLQRWNGDLSKRRIRIVDRELSAECFGTPSSTQRLHVFLSAGGGRLKDGVTVEFPRASWHPWLDGVSVNIDDPTFASFPGRLQTGWYLGTPVQDGVIFVAEIISRIQARYGIPNDNVYIIGSSAGGTAALKVAAAIDGATAIAENPPLFPHRQSSVKYYQKANLDLDTGVFRERNELGHIFQHPSSRFFILQNAEDAVIVEQLKELLADSGLPLPGIGFHESGSLSLYFANVPTTSPHHAFLTVGEFLSVLRIAPRPVRVEIRAQVLDAVFEGVRGRALAGDRISNLKGWAKFFETLNVPALEDPPRPSDAAVVRLALRARADVTYRLRLSHQAKNVSIALDVKPETSLASPEEVKRTAEANSAALSAGQSGWTLRIAGTTLDHAAARLRGFVDGTAHLFQTVTEAPEPFDRTA